MLSSPQSILWKEVTGKNGNVSTIVNRQLLIGDYGLIKIVSREDSTDIKTQAAHERVLIFTTENLMARFSLSDEGSVSTGTINCDHYSQVIMLKLRLGKKLLPVAYGLLPNNKNNCYRMFFNEIDQCLRERDIENCVDYMMYNDESVMVEMKIIWEKVEGRKSSPNFEKHQKMWIRELLTIKFLDLLIQHLCETLLSFDELLERMATSVDKEDVKIIYVHQLASDQMCVTTSAVQEESIPVINDEYIEHKLEVKKLEEDIIINTKNMFEDDAYLKGHKSGGEHDVEPDGCHLIIKSISTVTVDIFKSVGLVKEYYNEDPETCNTLDQNCNVIKSADFEDCKICTHCLDMRKYGGPGKLKQRCKLKPKGMKRKANSETIKEALNSEDINFANIPSMVEKKTDPKPNQDMLKTFLTTSSDYFRRFPYQISNCSKPRAATFTEDDPIKEALNSEDISFANIPSMVEKKTDPKPNQDMLKTFLTTSSDYFRQFPHQISNCSKPRAATFTEDDPIKEALNSEDINFANIPSMVEKKTDPKPNQDMLKTFLTTSSDYFRRFPHQISNCSKPRAATFTEDDPSFPKGWKIKITLRKGGLRVDKEYLSPEIKVFRSKVAVVEYMKAMGGYSDAELKQVLHINI